MVTAGAHDLAARTMELLTVLPAIRGRSSRSHRRRSQSNACRAQISMRCVGLGTGISMTRSHLLCTGHTSYAHALSFGGFRVQPKSESCVWSLWRLSRSPGFGVRTMLLTIVMCPVSQYAHDS